MFAFQQIEFRFMFRLYKCHTMFGDVIVKKTALTDIEKHNHRHEINTQSDKSFLTSK